METPISLGIKRNRDQVSPQQPEVNKCCKMSQDTKPGKFATTDSISLSGDAPVWANQLLQAINQVSDNQKILYNKQEQKIVLLQATVKRLERNNNSLQEKLLQQEIYSRKKTY